MMDSELEFVLRKEALDAALSLNRSYIGNRREWQGVGVIAATDVIDDAELFYQFLKG